ncbi:MAG: PKD domain-containing protein, partial [Sphingobacteriales bacterium]
MKHTNLNVIGTAFETGTVEVKAPATHTTTIGINNFDFTTPFAWDGTSNILIQTCWSNGTGTSVGSTVKADATTYASTRRGQSDNLTPANMCGVVTPGTSANLSQRPKFIFGYDLRCESVREEVVAYIRPVPEVDLGPDRNVCLDAGAVEVLDAGVHPDNPQFHWDNNTTSQVCAVSETGTYIVKVTNEYTCSDADTIQVIIRSNPVVELGNDTSVCNGALLTLDAGDDGIEYFWNTGQNTQTINISSAGSYNVFVTNDQGCTKADTINVQMNGEFPTVQGIQTTNNGQYTFTFTAINPQYVVGYDWDFGDGSLHSNQASPTHTYQNDGNYIVVLRLT